MPCAKLCTITHFEFGRRGFQNSMSSGEARLPWGNRLYKEHPYEEASCCQYRENTRTGLSTTREINDHQTTLADNVEARRGLAPNSPSLARDADLWLTRVGF